MFGIGIPELIILSPILLIIVWVKFGKKFKKKLKGDKPDNYPVYSIVFGWLIIAILVLTLLFSQSGHVLSFISSILRLLVVILLGRAYYLIQKQRNYVQTIWLLLTVLLLWIPILWQWSIKSPTHSHSLMLNNPGYFLATMLGGSTFIWRPIWYLRKQDTKQLYQKLERGKDTDNKVKDRIA